MSSSKKLQAAGDSIASNISVQVFIRAVTFILRAITLKYLQSTALLGIIHVRLALLYTTLQFLSREPFRRACIGEAATNDKRVWPKVVNTIWLGFLLSLFLSIPLTYIWYLNPPSVEDLTGTTVEDYRYSLPLMCLAVIIEMIGEPCFIYAQAKTIPSHNPKVEALSVVIKCVVACFFVIQCSYFGPDQSSNILRKISYSHIIASSISVIYSYTKLCVILKCQITDFLPSIKNSLHGPGLKLSASFVSQTFLKQLLTEGERYVMTFIPNVISLSEQGIYEVINNLCSLGVRLVFKPIEDAGYTLFSQTVSRVEKLDIRKFYTVQGYLMSLIKSMILLGLIIFTFGFNYIPLIVLYGGDKLNNPSAFYLMKCQLLYTLVLAVNGVTECFTFAIMKPSDIRTYNTQLILYFFTFLASIYITQSTLGSSCFIFANGLVMVLRIIASLKLIRNYFNKHGYQLKLEDSFPSLTTFISLVGGFIFLSVTQHYLLDLTQPILMLCGLILGTWCFMFIVLVVMCHEEALVDFVSKLFKIKLD